MPVLLALGIDVVNAASEKFFAVANALEPRPAHGSTEGVAGAAGAAEATAARESRARGANIVGEGG